MTEFALQVAPGVGLYEWELWVYGISWLVGGLGCLYAMR